MQPVSDSIDQGVIAKYIACRHGGIGERSFILWQLCKQTVLSFESYSRTNKLPDGLIAAGRALARRRIDPEDRMDRQELAWLLRRLRAMPVREYPHRVREMAKRAAWRKYHNGWAGFEGGDGVLPIIPGLAMVISGVAQSTVEEYAASARRNKSGELHLLGRRWPVIDLLGEPSAWHLDPVSGELWPATPYCFDVPRRGRSVLGDVKFVWELNRLQMLPGAALVALRQSDPAWGRWCLDVIASWMAANPPFRGVNWSSGIELAFRLISVILVASLLPAQWLTRADRSMIRSFCEAHLFWIARYPSLFSSANNHLLAEAVGLFAGAALVKDLPDAPRLHDYARRVLEREVPLQLLPDGVGAEQSTGYSAYVLELLLFAALVGRSVGTPLSSRVAGRVQKAAEALHWFSDGFGNTPSIGDDDQTRIIPDPSGCPDYPGSVVACVSGFFSDPELEPPLQYQSLRNAAFGAKSPQGASRSGLKTFRSGGYTILRDRHLERWIHLVFDHGPLGYLSLAAHGHADTLAIWLSIDGQPIFVDAGTHLYSGPRRDGFRGTPSHNTLSLGSGSSLFATSFSWTHKARGELHSCSDGPAWRVVGSHDGYLKRYGVRHVRQVAAAPDGILITDRLVGRMRRNCELRLRFLLDPTLDVERVGSTFAISKGGICLVELVGDPELVPEIEPRCVATSFSELAQCKGILLRGDARPGELTQRLRFQRNG